MSNPKKKRTLICGSKAGAPVKHTRDHVALGFHLAPGQIEKVNKLLKGWRTC